MGCLSQWWQFWQEVVSVRQVRGWVTSTGGKVLWQSRQRIPECLPREISKQVSWPSSDAGVKAVKPAVAEILLGY